MPLSVLDPRYRAEETPASIDALGVRLCAAFARTAGAFGAKGNTIHYSGYHRSRNWILGSPDSRWGARDYSVQRALDQGGDGDWISAFDFTPAEWGTPRNRDLMRQITRRVWEAARARDPRLASLREFAGTLDGSNVVTFNCADGSFKSAFDSSHLDHVHGSFWRSYAARDHSGIADIITGGTVHTLMQWRRPDGTDHPAVFKTDGVTARWIQSQEELADVRTLHSEGWLPLTGGGGVRVVGRRSLIGVIVGPVPADWPDRPEPLDVELGAEDLDAIAAAAREGAAEGATGATPDEVRAVVDAELDEAFAGGADNDSPTG